MKGHLVASLSSSLSEEWLAEISPSPGLHPYGPGTAEEPNRQNTHGIKKTRFGRSLHKGRSRNQLASIPIIVTLEGGAGCS